jgi:hypothetical protein
MAPLGSPDAGLLLKFAEIASATVKPSDLRTISLVTPDPQDQIANGKTTLNIERDVVFSRRVIRNGATKSLAMDIQMPAGGGTKPLVVYIAGGGFMFAPQEIASDLRTFVAESAFVERVVVAVEEQKWRRRAVAIAERVGGAGCGRTFEQTLTARRAVDVPGDRIAAP